MIHEIGVELQGFLRAKGCPVEVVDGPERTKTATWSRERIVIEHTQDTYDSAISQRVNPRQRRTVRAGYKLTIYAQASEAGALEYEHRRRAERIRDMVLVAMDRVASGRRNDWEPKSGGFITPDDMQDAETVGGAVYELEFTFDRGIVDVTFAGAKAAEATFIHVTMAGNPSLTFANVGATGDTITRSTGSWLTDGFTAGLIITVVGSAGNNVTGPIASLTATVITLGTTALVNEGPVAGCAVSAGGLKSTTKVWKTGDVDDDGNPATAPATAETSCGN